MARLKVSRNIVLLGLVSFFSDASSEIYFAILPFFILELGGNGFAIGVVAGFTDAFVSFMKGGFGFIADKLRAGRKKYVYWGYGMPAFFKFIMAFSLSWPMLLVLRLFERFGKGIRSAPRDAMIAESAPAEIMGRSFGFHRTMDTLGAIIGSSLALFFLFADTSFKSLMILSAAIALLTLIPLSKVTETREEPLADEAQDKVSLNDFISSGADSEYWKLVFVSFFHGLSLISYMFFLLYTSSVDRPDSLESYTIAEIAILFYIFFNIIYSMTSYGAGILADKYSKLRTLQIGFLIYLIALLLFLISSNFVMLVAAFGIYGISYGFIEGNFRAILAGRIDKKYKATGYGVFHLVYGMGLLIGNLMVGYLFDRDAQFGFSIGIGFAFIALILILRIRK